MLDSVYTVYELREGEDTVDAGIICTSIERKCTYNLKEFHGLDQRQFRKALATLESDSRVFLLRGANKNVLLNLP